MNASKPSLAISLALFSCLSAACATTEVDFKSAYYALGLSRTNPAIASLSVDCLGKGQLTQNPVCVDNLPAPSWQIQKLSPKPLACRYPNADSKSPPAWEFEFAQKAFVIHSRFIEGQVAAPLVLTFNQRSNHATLLGLMTPHEQRVVLPAVLHLPDMGSVRITANALGWKLDCDARRNVPQPFVRISFPAATRAAPRLEYHFEVAAIYPRLKGIEKDPLFDGFRRSYLNILQVNPRLQMLANNSSSDPCAFTIYEYADIARRAARQRPDLPRPRPHDHGPLPGRRARLRPGRLQVHPRISRYRFMGLSLRCAGFLPLTAHRRLRLH